MRRLGILGLAVCWPLAASWAQVLAPNEAGVSMSAWHTIVRDVDATRKFWTLVGGKPIKVDGTDVMKFPGVLIFMTPGSPPPGGNKGTAVDHPGFTMTRGEELLGMLKAAGYMVEPIGNPEYGPESGYITTPDGLRVEMQGNDNNLSKRPLLGFSGRNLAVPVASDHLHYLLPESAAPDAQAWYIRLLGAHALKESNRASTLAGDLPGIRLRFGTTPNAATLAPTKNRAMDYVGFEVTHFEAFCKTLEARGITLDQPYSTTRHKSFASAGLTDPWGLSIELTEGLSKY